VGLDGEQVHAGRMPRRRAADQRNLVIATITRGQNA
jgi:Trp operon repressor